MSLLEPYRVVDLTDGRGNLAGLLLAQLGAEVIAVERPGAPSARRHGVQAAGVAAGEGSLDHWAFNRGKRSVVLDPVNEQADRDVLDRLLAGADVLFESLDPPDREALGLLPARTAERYPALVHTSPCGSGTARAGASTSTPRPRPRWWKRPRPSCWPPPTGPRRSGGCRAAPSCLRLPCA